MKDTERMSEEEKRRYIFEDTSFEGRPRFNWLTNNLLGDIQTFLDGIEYFIIQNKVRPAGKSPRGGGNLSVPILINTALEFVSQLYAGKTDDRYMKFSFPNKGSKEESHINELNNRKIPNEFNNEFKNRKFPLPENPSVDVVTMDKEWKIRDDVGTKDNCYVITLTDNEKKLRIHFLEKAKYQSVNIVEPFLKYFFPKEYREIPLLLWDGIRNGLVHTFSPKPFEYNGSYIRFQFYVEDQNFPSHIEKASNAILIRINVFELYRVLEKAVEAYRAKLENSAELQDKFIRAWSSIEEYTEKADDNQSNEVEKLREDLKLDSKSSAFLLKDLNDHLNVDILKIYSLKIRRS